MRGNNVMKGYFEQPDASAEAFRGGWFHSGDIAVWHPDGYIELRDRKKDIIISGGENISTIEVEQAVARHPAVMECAVVAVPDEKWGERPKAFVTLKPGMKATEAEVIEFCRQHIAHFKCPAAVEFGHQCQARPAQRCRHAGPCRYGSPDGATHGHPSLHDQQVQGERSGSHPRRGHGLCSIVKRGENANPSRPSDEHDQA